MKLNRLIQIAEQSEQLARGAVATSLGSTGFVWLGVANEVLTAIATIIAIISGLYATRFYYLKSKHFKEEGDKDDTQ